MSHTEHNPVSLLLVEDDAIDVMTVERMLRKQHIANPLFVARDGVEALEMLRGQGGRQPVPAPFLILLDLNMPRMNGLEFLTELRRDPQHQRATVFVLTTSDAPEDRLAAYEHRVAGYIVKDRMGEDLLDLLMIQFAHAGRDWTPREIDTGALLKSAVEKLRVLDDFKLEVSIDMPRLRTAGVPLEYVFTTLLGHIARRRRRRAGRLDVTWEDTGTHLRFSMLVSGSSRPRTETSKNIRDLMEAGPLSNQDAETVGLVVTRNVVESVGGLISMVPSGTAASFTWPREWPSRWETAPPMGTETELPGDAIEPVDFTEYHEEDTQLVQPDPSPALFMPPEDLRELSPERPDESLLLILGEGFDAQRIEDALRERDLSNPVYVARSGERAMAMLRGEAADHDKVEKPYTVLLDLALPGMNGLELLDTLRHDPDHHRAPVFVLALDPTPEDRQAAFEHRVAGFFPAERCGEDYSDLAAFLALYWQLNAPPPV